MFRLICGDGIHVSIKILIRITQFGVRWEMVACRYMSPISGRLLPVVINCVARPAPKARAREVEERAPKFIEGV